MAGNLIPHWVVPSSKDTHTFDRNGLASTVALATENTIWTTLLNGLVGILN